jgi:putative FmdB family regulatory protein
VPTYEYQCDACQRVFEVRQRISEEPLTVCDVCGGHVRRLISPAPFILKGDGWYVTDYPSEARKKAMESEKSSTTSTEKTSTEKSSTEKSSTEKAADKPSTPAPSSAPSSASSPAGSSTTSTSD